MKIVKKSQKYIVIIVIIVLLFIGYRSYLHNKEISKIELALYSPVLKGLTLRDPKFIVDIVSPKNVVGVAEPKMTVWVTLKDGNEMITEGVAKITEHPDGSYEVLHYHSKEKLLADPNILREVYTNVAEKKIKENYLK